MTTRLVLASSNKGKLREFTDLLASHHTQVIAQGDLAITDADETGLSFVENAIIKARHACAASGLPALADDSGLEVDALRGAPGIYSARYAGTAASDEANRQALLEAMAAVDKPDRSARYQCVIVYMRHTHDPTPLICQASWEGEILTTPQGEGGFGYDALFWLPEQQCSAAELSLAQKQTLSHRGQATRQFLRHYLQRMS